MTFPIPSTLYDMAGDIWAWPLFGLPELIFVRLIKHLFSRREGHGGF
jgi:hypothetical protein